MDSLSGQISSVWEKRKKGVEMQNEKGTYRKLIKRRKRRMEGQILLNETGEGLRKIGRATRAIKGKSEKIDRQGC